MKKILVAGAGHIGSLIAKLLADSGQYDVSLVDTNSANLATTYQPENFKTHEFDVTDQQALQAFVKKTPVEAVVASLPYFCNVPVAKFAHDAGIHYFDLTEDVGVADAVKKLADNQSQAFVPRCGVAPGFINIIAQHLMQDFDEVDTAKMRVGCLPVVASNALQYLLTWSIDGLINEYGNVGYGLAGGKKITLQPLEGMEEVQIDGVLYEAFNTSGGAGSLIDSCVGKVNVMNYKTLRYPGHRDKIRFLMQDLNLNNDRDTLKKILLNGLPRSTQDVLILYSSVTGTKDGQLQEINYVKKLYPHELFGAERSAIQLGTASACCAVIDLVMSAPDQYHGFICQEEFSYDSVLNNQFGAIFGDD